jgi:hypothetical protein
LRSACAIADGSSTCKCMIATRSSPAFSGGTTIPAMLIFFSIDQSNDARQLARPVRHLHFQPLRRRA